MATATADPETEEVTGTCCTGGWVYVSEKWATQEATVTLEDGTKVVDQERLAGLLNTVYPCKVHNATQFYRWAGGHMKPEHDKASCVECRAPGGTRARGARPGQQQAVQEPLPTTPPRRDLD